MSGSVSDYITHLEQQLRQRGIVDTRILAEAREHLIDAIEEGREHGLSAADAEHEAFERFGAPEIVAAHILEERDRMKTGIVGALGTIWQRKWWILVPTVFAAVVTGVTSDYFQPVRYRSVTTILVVAPRVPGDDTGATNARVTPRGTDTLRRLTTMVLSRERLAGIMNDFALYDEERKSGRLDQAIEQMRDDIRLDMVQSDVFRISFVSSNPRTAMQVTAALASFVIDENLKLRAVVTESAKEFLDSQIEETREQIVAQEKYLETLRAERGGRPLSPADLIPYEMLKESYKALLGKQMDAAIALNLERRQIGEQFRILDPARLPERPDGPNRVRVAILGALVGLAVGLVLVVLRRSSNTSPPALAEA